MTDKSDFPKIDEFAVEAIGPFVPGRGTFGAPMAYASYSAKTRDVAWYVTEFVALEGWPPEGRHLVRFWFDGKDRSFVAHFRAYNCGLMREASLDLVQRALKQEWEASPEDRFSALHELEKKGPLIADCARAVFKRRTEEAKIQRITTAKDYFTLLGSFLVIGVFVLSAISAVFAFLDYVLPRALQLMK